MFFQTFTILLKGRSRPPTGPLVPDSPARALRRQGTRIAARRSRATTPARLATSAQCSLRRRARRGGRGTPCRPDEWLAGRWGRGGLQNRRSRLGDLGGRGFGGGRPSRAGNRPPLLSGKEV